MPDLNPDSGSGEKSYLLRRLVYHLARADRWEELHALVSEGGGSNQAWAQSRWSGEGSYAGYLEDIDVAWDHADRSLTTSQKQVGRQLRYGLITASIRGRSVHVPATLLRALLEQGLWTDLQALAHIRELIDHDQMTASICALAPSLSPEHVEEVYGQISRLPRVSERIKALAALAQVTSTTWRRKASEDALSLLSNVSSGGAFVRSITTLAPSLEPDQWLSALAVIGDWPWPDERFQALALALPAVPDDLVLDPVAHLIAPDETSVLPEKVEAMAALALRLAPEDAHPIWKRALDLALALENQNRMGECVAALAPSLPADLVAEAAAGAAACQAPAAGARAIAALLPRLCGQAQTDLLEIGLAAVARMPTGTDPAHVRQLAAFLPSLPAPESRRLFELALKTARSNDWSTARAAGFACLIPFASTTTRDALRREALTALEQPDNDYRRAEAMTELAPVLAGSQREQLLALALAIADDSDRAHALAGLAPHLPAEAQPRLLEATRAIDDEETRARLLSSLAPHLTPKNLTLALEIAQGIRDDDQLTMTRIALALQTMPDRSPLSPEELLAQAAKIRDAEAQVRTLRRLCGWLSAEQRPEAWRQLVDGLRRCSPARVPNLLSEMVAELEPAVTASILEIIDGWWSASEREAATQALAPALPEDRLREALDLFSAVAWPYDDVAILARILPRLEAADRDAFLRRLLDRTCAGDENDCAALIAGLAALWPPAMFAKAQARAAAFKQAQPRLTVWIASLPHISPGEQKALLAKIVQALSKVGDWSRRVDMAQDLIALEQLTESQARSLIPAMREIGDHGTRARGLATLLPALNPDYRRPIAAEALNDCRQVVMASDRAQICALLAPYRSSLPGWDEVFWAAYEEMYAGQRPGMVLAAFPYLPLHRRAQYLSMAITETIGASGAVWTSNWPGLIEAWETLLPEEQRDVWAQTAHAMGERSRPLLLQNLAGLGPVVANLGGDKAIDEAARAIDDVSCWWP